ncbi:MAG: hypothetical protein ACI4W6_05830 [Acutalibacteraceae bacterium]
MTTVKKADRSDLTGLLSILYENEPVPIIDEKLINRFDEILAQTNHSVLIAYQNKKPVATLSLTIIDGLESGCPKAYITSCKISQSAKREEAEAALVEKACLIASGYGCAKVKISSGNYAGKRMF